MDLAVFDPEDPVFGQYPDHELVKLIELGQHAEFAFQLICTIRVTLIESDPASDEVIVDIARAQFVQGVLQSRISIDTFDTQLLLDPLFDSIDIGEFDLASVVRTTPVRQM